MRPRAGRPKLQNAAQALVLALWLAGGGRGRGGRGRGGSLVGGGKGGGLRGKTNHPPFPPFLPLPAAATAAADYETPWTTG